MVEYSTALHFPALAVMSVPVTIVLHFIVTHVIVTETCAKYRIQIEGFFLCFYITLIYLELDIKRYSISHQ